MIDEVAERLVRRLILAFLLGGLLLLSYSVLHLFIVPVAWAVIVAYATWPLYQRLRDRVVHHRTASALLMTLLLTAAFVLPALWIAVLLRGELGAAISALVAQIRQGPPTLPDFIRGLPWLGDYLQALIDNVMRDPESIRQQMTGWVSKGADALMALVGDVGRNAAKLGFALITVFFLFRDGENVLRQVRRVLYHFLGARIDGYLAAVGSMTKAVVWGLVATALAQGFVAGLGYWWAGVQAPVLLGAITALIALIPFGTPFAWGSVAVWLLVRGDMVEGIGLLAWGVLVVSWVDNLVRPLVISNATRIPFLLVMFGVLGGLAAFGLVGLFLGPVILAVLMAVWREWIEDAHLTPLPQKTSAPAPADAPPPDGPAP
ncbi:AI-2E family transporter [Pseudothauera nasutitermitis]|uniref:AI-2E family transporter n=1 Tax=Pseudothauera nasutitermitis TaxID=2565930 RepID=A0A4S4B6D0_9RHOO|nr:AI-2E family transporter [Pseudothauera nasutitermitis]THF67386.1 AI-2E family transporter [Pseudothauera nasutitermitis]